MLKKDKFSPLLFRLSLLQKLTQQWSWAMLACIPYARPVSIWCATQSKTALRDKGVLDPMVLFSIWGLFWKILAAQLHHFQDKSPAFCNGRKTYPICLIYCSGKGRSSCYPIPIHNTPASGPHRLFQETRDESVFWPLSSNLQVWGC